MKKFLLSLFAFSIIGSAFSQQLPCFSFTGGDLQGFTGGQGISAGAYDNPLKNGCGNADDDYGLITPGVGGNNPGNLQSPTLVYAGAEFVNFTFKLFVFTANLKCTSNQPLPCETKARAYIVAPTYSSNTPPTGSDAIAISNLILVSALGGTNNMFFTLTAAQEAYLIANPNYKVYLDLQADNCNQGGLKYVFDDFCIIETENTPLPVHFSSFNAIRSNASLVGLTWTTALEQNNKGFNVQENVNGEWKTIAFVPSQAPDGNSSSALTYNYSDINTEKGITQYRIQQVDLDGRFVYTDIRAIRGEGAIGKVIVYPNPSTGDKINVVFEDNLGVRDIIVNDMQGKVIRSFKGITNNILVIERLTSGFYTIKVTNRTTAASSVQKVVIK